MPREFGILSRHYRPVISLHEIFMG